MVVKPLVKYIGGKSWLGDKLREKIKLTGSNKLYGEAFFGGGGAFFQVAPVLECSEIRLNDISRPVIALYSGVVSAPHEILEWHNAIEDEFQYACPKIETTDKGQLAGAKEYFESIKVRFNELKMDDGSDATELAAHFMFLQQHSFNGIYRENKKGLYNTPFNWSWGRFDEQKMTERVNAVVALFKRFDSVVFTNLDVFDLDTSKGTWYFDPPYVNDEGGENAYASGGFSNEHQMRLIAKVKECEHFIYSNHMVPMIVEQFSDCEYEAVGRRNIMSAKANNRSEERAEILVWW